MNIYIDNLTGNDSTGNGTIEKPYKTLLTVMKTKLTRNGVNYDIYLGEGTYQIDGACLYNILNSQITIEGKSEKTIVRQIDSLGGFTSASFTLTFRKLIYDIDETLLTANLNTFKMQWNLYNVVFNKCPNNPYGVFLPLEGATITFRNCIKTKNTTNLFRLTNGNAKVYDSYGGFTSGLSTTNSMWNISGNVITATPQYDPLTFNITDSNIGNNIGVYSGIYSWKNVVIKSLFFNQGYYKTINSSDLNTWINVSDTVPTPQQFIDSGITNLSILDRVMNYSPLDLLVGDIELATWVDDPSITALSLNSTVAQNNQIVYAIDDIDITGVETIDNFILTATPETKIAVSFDSGLTYKVYRNGVWEVVSNAENWMTVAQINTLSSAQITEVRGDSNKIRFGYHLTSVSEVDKIQMKVSLQGVDAVAKTADYELSYNQSQRKLTYLIKKNGTYSINYMDGAS